MKTDFITQANILAEEFESATCRMCRMHEKFSPNVDQSLCKYLIISRVSTNLAAAQALERR